jgi:dipeptidyl aminopeptidase/acylaminoacyl peptidase
MSDMVFRFNPSKFVSKWRTPQLVIHGGKDYRVAEAEGIGAFHALQQYVISRENDTAS